MENRPWGANASIMYEIFDLFERGQQIMIFLSRSRGTTNPTNRSQNQLRDAKDAPTYHHLHIPKCSFPK
jgi:hypothetical protein